MLNFVSATKSVKRDSCCKKKISINDTQIGLVRTRIHSNTNSNLDIELLIYFHRPKLI